MNKGIIGKYVAVVGLMLFWAPLWGIVDTYLIMTSSFQEITLFGPNEPKISQEEMSSAALSIAIGFILFLVALCLLTFLVVGLNYRTKWLFWTLIIYSTLLLFMFPIGTLFGIIVLVALVLSRKKFGLAGDVT
jgi:glucan phosphoethanolaminetransferase (alkaline phosphatase superfamily)